MKKFKLLLENGTEDSLKNSTVTSSKNWFRDGGVVLNERDAVDTRGVEIRCTF
jgi:hypothetical protein